MEREKIIVPITFANDFELYFVYLSSLSLYLSFVVFASSACLLSFILCSML